MSEKFRITSIRAGLIQLESAPAATPFEWPGKDIEGVWVDEAHHFPANTADHGLKVLDWLNCQINVDGKLTVMFKDEALMRRMASGHWVAYQRKWKRQYRKAWQKRWPQVKVKASRGWRRHIRKQKAKR